MMLMQFEMLHFGKAQMEKTTNCKNKMNYVPITYSYIYAAEMVFYRSEQPDIPPPPEGKEVSDILIEAP